MEIALGFTVSDPGKLEKMAPAGGVGKDGEDMVTQKRVDLRTCKPRVSAV